MRPDIDVDSMEIADAVELAEEGAGDDSVSGEQMRPDGKRARPVSGMVAGQCSTIKICRSERTMGKCMAEGLRGQGQRQK